MCRGLEPLQCEHYRAFSAIFPEDILMGVGRAVYLGNETNETLEECLMPVSHFIKKWG